MISNTFQHNFLKLLKLENGNIVCSPIAIYFLLSLLEKGAIGKTKEEIVNCLTGGSGENYQSYIAQMLKFIKEKEVELAFLFLTKVKPSKDFIDSCKDYNALIDSLENQEQIHNWIIENTSDKIRSLLENDLKDDDIIVLLNALNIKKEWTKEFKVENNKKMTFLSRVNNETIPQEVLMMSLMETTHYYENEYYQIVEKTFKDKAFSSFIILPKEDIDNSSFYKGAFPNGIEEAITNCRKEKQQGVQLTLPKFLIKTSLDLKPLLQSLGINEVFNDLYSQLDKICEGLFIRKASQKTFLSVNEKGTEAGAVTALIATIGCGIIPVTVLVDHPFYFIITMDSPINEVILFFASVNEITN